MATAYDSMTSDTLTLSELQPIAKEFARLFVQAVREELSTALPSSGEKLEVLTPGQVAQELGKSPTTIRAWCKAGLLGKKISRPNSSRPQYLIHRDQLNEFLKCGEPVKERVHRRCAQRQELVTTDPDIIALCR